MEEREICVEIDEWVEARIWEHGVLKSTQLFRGNTVLANGRYNLALLLTGGAGYPIDRMWAVAGSTIEDTCNVSRSGDTLSLETSTPYTVAGTYSAIMTGSNNNGPASPYNSIGINIVLTPGSELDFTVRWVFSGDAGSGFYGNAICAARLGNDSTDYDYPLASVAVFLAAAIQDVVSATFNVLSNGTFYIGQSSPFSGPATFDSVRFATNGTSIYRYFDKVGGFTVDVASGTTIDTLTEIELG